MEADADAVELELEEVAVETVLLKATELEEDEAFTFSLAPHIPGALVAAPTELFR